MNTLFEPFFRIHMCIRFGGYTKRIHSFISSDP